MDNKEAIYYLQYLRHDVHANSPYDIAIVTAINALSETAPPKSNADRIRQMTDEELAEFLEKNCSCPNCCIYHPASCKHIRAQCIEGYNKWLRKEVSEDAETA